MQSEKIEAPGREPRGLSREKNSAPLFNSVTEPTQEDKIDDILTCWRWARSLDQRLAVYQLQLECGVAGALMVDHDRLATEITSFNAVAKSLDNEGPTA